MNKFQTMLDSNKMSLIVSLPANNIEFARAAIRGGANAVKVHINVFHRASGNTFGSFDENQEFFDQLFSEFSGPIGIVPGGSSKDILETELNKIEEKGFSFYSMYMHETSTSLLRMKSIAKTVAGDFTYQENDISLLKDFGISAFEASIVPGEQYGDPLTVKNLINYKEIVNKVKIPVILPSQKKLIPEDVQLLHQAGISAVMIGAVVTGKEVGSIERSTYEFKNAIDKL